MGNKVVEIKNLSKKYRKANKFAIDEISLECYEGEIVGLLGKNGAGKSTTIKCLTGFYDFEKGNVKICDHDIKKDPIAAKQNLGYVPDNRATFEKMTGLEYINFIADLHKVPTELREQRLEEMQGIFKLGDKINNLISSYSHGMKQKVCLMASLIHSPKLWLLDEPLTGLDPNSIYQVKECMKEHAREGNIVFFSSHIIDVVEKICDRIAIIKKGKIVCEANVQELENSGTTLEQFYMNTNKNTQKVGE